MLLQRELFKFLLKKLYLTNQIMATKNNFWCEGLVKALADPNNQIISTDIAVVIKDKYPKAKHHYLVLPKENIPSIYELKRSHLDLLSELYLLAMNVIEVTNCQKENFKIGFHVRPSMQRLHLHVISQDFTSPCLKTKKHWNSFNTKLFLPFDELVQTLTKNGTMQRLDNELGKDLEKTELKCNQCNYKPKNIPDLRSHLLFHVDKSSEK